MMKAAIFNLGSRGQNAIYGIFWYQPKSKDEDLLKRGTHYVMRAIAFVEDPDVIKKILKHLGLWDVKRKPQPVANAPPIDVFPAYDEQPGPSADDYIADPDYPAGAYF
jgi:hypothetical protein